jgi:hypothetical protein
MVGRETFFELGRAFDPRAEQTRVRAHILRAETAARAADAPRDPVAALVRELLLEALREYREDGAFPHNHSRPELGPVFVDEHGTRCAVGHLLALTGEHALVDRIASARNLATVHELADEPALLDWLSAAGLSLEEAALIQPGYSPACGSAVSCFCGDPYDGGVQAPAAAVLDCTMVSPELARITQIHGAQSVHAVGNLIRIGPNSEASMARVLVPVNEQGQQPPPRWVLPDAGEPVFYSFIPVRGEQGTCMAYGTGTTVTLNARVSSIIQSVTSSNCAETLARVEPASTTRRCAGDCSCTTVGITAAPGASVGLLLALVSALAHRRARRAHRAKPTPHAAK